MARRIGFYTIRKLATQLCKYITRYTPIIAQLYDGSPALLAALAAANAACGVLVENIDLVQEPGV